MRPQEWWSKPAQASSLEVDHEGDDVGDVWAKSPALKFSLLGVQKHCRQTRHSMFVACQLFTREVELHWNIDEEAIAAGTNAHTNKGSKATRQK